MRRRLPLISLALLVCALLTAGCGSSVTSSSTSAGSSSAAGTATSSASSSASGSATQIGFEGVPLEQGPQLAPAGTTQTGTVNGIKCAPTEQLAYHIHAHLAVFENGTLYQLPAGVGIPGSTVQQTNQGPLAAGGHCLYWMHTHTPDGIIHVESPTKRIYTLGDFFDIWHQPLSHSEVGKLHGAITAFVNGKPWTKNPRAIPILPHENIQLEIGQPTPPIMSVNWSQTQL